METTSEQKKLLTYAVWSLDVWGHSGDECVEYDCACVEQDGKRLGLDNGDDSATKSHNPDACQCSYDVNDRHRAGKITVEVEGTTYNRGVLYDCRLCNGTGDGTPTLDTGGASGEVYTAGHRPCDACKGAKQVSAEFTSYSPTTEQLLAALKEQGILFDHVTLENGDGKVKVVFDFPSDEGYVEVNHADDGKPCLQLELESEEGAVAT